MKTYIKHFVSSLFLTAGLAISGCGIDHSPVASTPEPTFTQGSDGRTFLTFSAAARRGAGKITSIPAEGRSVTNVFGPQRDQLDLVERNGAGKLDDLRVRFVVSDRALLSPVEITMTVYGNTLEDLVVAFDPGGLVFLRDADLGLMLGRDLVHTSLEAIQVQHEYSDGHVEQATLHSVRDDGTTVTVRVKVPGFSRYSAGGGGP